MTTPRSMGRGAAALAAGPGEPVDGPGGTVAPLPRPRRFDLSNLLFLVVAHAAAVVGVVLLVSGGSSWWTVGLAVAWFLASGLAVTGGYHRLFAHRSYAAHPLLRALYLFFGAAAVQNSALKWASDHRRHHACTDRPDDPYDITRGFWWAHLGWIFFTDDGIDEQRVRDLTADPLVRFQHRFYLPLAVAVGALLPAALGLLWGDVLGALFVAGFLRLVLQWHSTFAINSVAHTIGRQPYSTRSSARDSFWTSLLTFGEGYHNFHHRFQFDYRNGVRRRDFDPTKWFIWSLSRIGITRRLRRARASAIESARAAVLAERRSRRDAA